MGEHKYNKTAIAAKNGEIAPKPKPLSKREMDRILRKRVDDTLRKSTGLGMIEKNLNLEQYFN